MNEIAGDYEVHPVMVQQGKRQALEAMTAVFSSKFWSETEVTVEDCKGMARQFSSEKV